MMWILITLIAALTVCILMGHNGAFVSTLCGINVAVFGKIGYDIIKKKGGQEDG